VNTAARRIPPNLFAAPFGIAGLATAWLAASRVLGLPRVVADVIELVAAAAWALLTVAYLRQGSRQVLADLRDTVAGPFVTLALITPCCSAPPCTRTLSSLAR
jgi:tellurite resistance protein TehA-like permease